MKRSKSNAKFKFTDRIASMVQRELADVLLYKTDNPLFTGVTIIHVDVSPDASIAKIFVTVLDLEKKMATMKALNDSAPMLKHLLAKGVNFRKTPSLRFIYDESVMRGQELSALIDDAVDADKKSKG